MGDLKASFSKEQFTVDIERDAATGAVTYEAWWKNDRRVTRSIQNFSEWEAGTLNQGKHLCPFSSRSKLHVPFKSSEGCHAGRAAAPP